MNTDGHAKGYAFDGLHSHFPAVPLIPISTFFLAALVRPVRSLVRLRDDAW